MVGLVNNDGDLVVVRRLAFTRRHQRNGRFRRPKGPTSSQRGSFSPIGTGKSARTFEAELVNVELEGLVLIG